MIITIDGPSGTGKTTVAKQVAQRLSFAYFDTGAMYRAVAYMIKKKQIDWQNKGQLTPFLQSFSFTISEEKGEKRYWANGEDVTDYLRTTELSTFASQVSKVGMIREKMVEAQHSFAKEGNAVFEGRDMGTVVFPEAEVKVFLTAEAKERARRRYEQLLKGGVRVEFDSILQEVEKRDFADSTREISPLKKASDAFFIDTTYIGIEEVVEMILEKVKTVS